MCPFIEVFDYARSLGKQKRCIKVTPKGKEVWRSDERVELKNIDARLEGDIEIIFYHFSRNPTDYAKTLRRCNFFFFF